MRCGRRHFWPTFKNPQTQQSPQHLCWSRCLCPTVVTFAFKVESSTFFQTTSVFIFFFQSFLNIKSILLIGSLKISITGMGVKVIIFYRVKRGGEQAPVESPVSFSPDDCLSFDFWALILHRRSANTTLSTTNCSRRSLKRRSWWKVRAQGFHLPLIFHLALFKHFFSASLFVRSAQRHPAAGATLHLQELVVFLRKPVW